MSKTIKQLQGDVDRAVSRLIIALDHHNEVDIAFARTELDDAYRELRKAQAVPQVYVLLVGEHSDETIHGVYATVSAANAALVELALDARYPADMIRAARIEPYEVQS